MNKYLIGPVKKRFSTLGIAENQIEAWAENWQFFFILGFGRSGTEFMANLLNHAPGAQVFHEPVLEDFNAYVKAFYSHQDAERYINGFRKKEIYTRMRHVPSGVYGEVNSALRRHAAAIKKTFSNATIIHLVRDGRDVVRSLMSRNAMTIRDTVSIRIHPNKTDPWRTRWNQMDRFSRLCWYWQVENSYLRATIGKTVQFEKILSSYDYFHDEILGPCQIYIDKKDWETTIGTPRNTTEKFQMPKWQDWTLGQQKTFREICGEEMANCGYPF